MNSINAGELLARALANEGVKFVFGLQCPEIDPFQAALASRRAEHDDWAAGLMQPVAEWRGCHGEYVQTAAELPEALSRARQHRGPSVVHVCTPASWPGISSRRSRATRSTGSPVPLPGRPRPSPACHADWRAG
jgi:thiamine pyrophosphate-dependent acetolactate synthase large subunit-like protein